MTERTVEYKRIMPCEEADEVCTLCPDRLDEGHCEIVIEDGPDGICSRTLHLCPKCSAAVQAAIDACINAAAGR